MPHAATLPMRVHQLIKQLEGKGNKHTGKEYTFTVVSREGVIYEVTRWEDDRWELITCGKYQISRRSVLRLLHAPADIVFLVFGVLQHFNGFVDDDEINELLKTSLELKKAAEPTNLLYKTLSRR